MEAPYYGVPTLDLGSRQKNRAELDSVITLNDYVKIKQLIKKFTNKKIRFKPLRYFGNGQSHRKFLSILNQKRIWEIKSQKQFIQIKY